MKLRTIIFFLLASVLFLFTVVPAQAVLIWGTDASSELIGGRTSVDSPSGGVDATQQWDDGGFTIDWDIFEVTADSGLWSYTYTVTGDTKGLSHFILEVTEDDDPFEVFGGDVTINEDSLKTWSKTNSNPLMPNPIFGVKFDFGSTMVTYTMVTNRAPVYGVFYTKDGTNDVEETINGEVVTVHYDVVAWSNALNDPYYKTTTLLTTNDYIVRPDGYTGYIPPQVIPEPATMLLLGSGLIGFAVSGRKKLKKRNG